MAIAMGQIIQPLIQNPAIMQALGVDQIIEVANKIGQKTGFFDRDFKLFTKLAPGSPEDQKAQMEKELQMVTALVAKITDEKLKVDLVPILQELKILQRDVAVVMHLTGAAPPEPPQQPQPPQPNAPSPVQAAPAESGQPPANPS